MRDNYASEIEVYALNQIHVNIMSEFGVLTLSPEKARNLAALLLDAAQTVEETQNA